MKKVSPLSFSLPMFICLCIIGCTNKSNSEKITSQDSFTKEKDLVPNRNTALEIAKAITEKLYSKLEAFCFPEVYLKFSYLVLLVVLLVF